MNLPYESIMNIPSQANCHSILLPSKNPKEPNTTVEMYFQIGPDSLRDRVLLDLLGQMMNEPLFDQLRTKEQFGYNVSCGPRWTSGTMGFAFKVVTSTKTAKQCEERLELFVDELRVELTKMKMEDFKDNVIGLAKNKLQMWNSLSEQTSHIWGEIVERSYRYEVLRDEVISLKSIVKDDLYPVYEKWFMKQHGKRKCFAVHIVGAKEMEAGGGGGLDLDVDAMEKAHAKFMKNPDLPITFPYKYVPSSGSL